MKSMLAPMLALAGLVAGSASASATCVKFYDAGGFWVAQNYCSYHVYVRWTDEGACSGGCGANLGRYSRQSVNYVNGRLSWRETYD
jgi:hypothetical protein